jgi:transposase
MENKRAVILHQMWTAGETAEAIGKRFGVSASTVCHWAQKYNLPKRQRPQKNKPADPSPEEIERLKAVLKERHIQERIREDVTNTHSKVSKWRRGIFQPRGVA